MNKSNVVAFLILGMGLTAAVLMMTVPLWFESPVSNEVKVVTVCSTVAFVVLTVLAIKLRKRIED